MQLSVASCRLTNKENNKNNNIMRRILIAAMAGIIISSAIPTMAQRHRHTPTTTVTVTNHSNGKSVDTTAIVAFSDTTSQANDEDSVSVTTPVDDTMDKPSSLSDIMEDALVPIVAIFCLFCLTPLICIGLPIYMVIKTRNQKMRIMEMAIKNGQPIPEGMIRRQSSEATLWSRGIQKIFLGLGIVLLGVFISSKSVMGIGFLVAFYGAGQALIAYTTKKNFAPDILNDSKEILTEGKDVTKEVKEATTKANDAATEVKTEAKEATTEGKEIISECEEIIPDSQDNTFESEEGDKTE